MSVIVHHHHHHRVNGSSCFRVMEPMTNIETKRCAKSANILLVSKYEIFMKNGLLVTSKREEGI